MEAVQEVPREKEAVTMSSQRYGPKARKRHSQTSGGVAASNSIGSVQKQAITLNSAI